MKITLTLFLVLSFAGFANSQTDISKVDFDNFTYAPTCGTSEAQSITVVKGRYFNETLRPVIPEVKKKKNTEPAPLYDRKFFSIFQIIFGDLNGDRINVAIILTTCSNGGIESFSEGFVYGIKDGETELLSRIAGGDRALGGLRSASIKDGVISVSRSKPGAFPDACCPEIIETTDYRLLDGNLSQIGEKTSVAIYPPMKIMVTEAPSQSAFNISIPKRAKFRRFVISAQKGQTITVTTTEPDARLRLFSGVADLIVNPKPIKKNLAYIAKDVLIANTKEAGDFVFEVANLSATNADLDVTVKLEIK